MNIGRKILIGLSCLVFSQQLMALNAADSVTEVSKIIEFNSLKINGNFNVVLTEGKSCSMKIVAPDKDALAAVMVKSGVTLNVTMKEGTKGASTLYITVKDLQQLNVNIEGTLSCTNKLDADAFTLNVDGNATVNLTFDTKMLNCTLNSGKPIVLKGKAKSCIFKDSGDGNVDASELKTENLTMEDDSDGDLKVYAHPEMHAKVNGGGNLTYYGNPRVKTFKLSGRASEQQIKENK
jgi:hypothetical protein